MSHASLPDVVEVTDCTILVLLPTFRLPFSAVTFDGENLTLSHGGRTYTATVRDERAAWWFDTLTH